jgi:nitrous oxidase accessory protein NosD
VLCLLTLLAVVAGCAGGDSNDGKPAAADPPAPRAHAAGPCDRYAAPTGSRRGSGTRAHPYGSLGRLLRGLRRGQVGCLMAGRYRHRGVVAMRRAGTTLRPLGKAHVTIDGALWVLPRAKGARITGLTLTSHDRVYSIPLKIQADDVSLVGNDITAAGNISCVLIGNLDRKVSHTLVERNRIHRCGRTGKLAHLIYVTHSQGAVIRDNLLVGNRGGWAVHLYPDADGTLIEGNVIDSNEGGVIFAGEGGSTSDGNVVRENVITNSAPRWNIEGSWSGGPEGEGNVAQRNCLFSAGPGMPSGIGFLSGFEQSDNVVAKDPVYVDRAGGDYRLQPGSNCGAVLMDVGGAKLRVGPR